LCKKKKGELNESYLELENEKIQSEISKLEKEKKDKLKQLRIKRKC